MSISVHVQLLSGTSITLAVEPEESVTSLCQRAQGGLRVGKGRLLTTSGDMLAGGTVTPARLQDNDLLTLHVGQVCLASRASAFTALLGDGCVVTWGHADRGGDSSSAQAHLQNVQQVQASPFAFAAIRADGFVVTWDMTALVATAVPCKICSRACSRCKLLQGRLLRSGLMDLW